MSIATGRNGSQRLSPSVFVTQDLGTFNLVPAEEHGTIVVVIDRRVSHVGLSRAFTTMRERMNGITKNDWIVPTGHPALIGFACYLMAVRTGVIRLLVWDRQSERYVQTEVRVS